MQRYEKAKCLEWKSKRKLQINFRQKISGWPIKIVKTDRRKSQNLKACLVYYTSS